jgi:hypothetical protein
MTLIRNVAASVLIALCGLGFQSAQAGPLFGGHGGGGLRLDTPYLPPGREARDEEPNISPNEAAQRAQQINGGGRVLSVEKAGNGYRVKLLREGEVRVIVVH